MELNKFQIESKKTWLFNHNNDEVRAILGLVGEAGEIAEKYKKFLRGDGKIDKEDIKKELGDVLYYLARIADNYDLTLSDIGETNIKKLEDRQKRGVLKGSGDNR